MRVIDPFYNSKRMVGIGARPNVVPLLSKRSENENSLPLKSPREPLVEANGPIEGNNQEADKESLDDLNEINQANIIIERKEPPRLAGRARLMSHEKSCMACGSKGRRVDVKIREFVLLIGKYSKKKDLHFCAVDFEFVRMGVETTNALLKIYPEEPTSFTITLLMPTKELAEEWKNAIKETIALGRTSPKRRLREGVSMLEAEMFFKKLQMPQGWLKDRVESGDIILFQSKNKGAKLQRIFTKSEFGNKTNSSSLMSQPIPSFCCHLGEQTTSRCA